jgi:hypothetical protein
LLTRTMRSPCSRPWIAAAPSSSSAVTSNAGGVAAASEATYMPSAGCSFLPRAASRTRQSARPHCV